MGTFNEEDIKMLASHMSPIMDKLIDARKLTNLETLKITVWKDDEVWITTYDSLDFGWKIIKNGDNLEVEITTKKNLENET